MADEVPSFRDWYNSAANPLHTASNALVHFSRDAMQAAFEAGEARAKFLRQKAKAETRGDDIENPFT